MHKKVFSGLILLIIVASIMAFTGCGDEPRMPLRQGSEVFEILGEPVEQTEVSKYENYSEFKNSDYADMIMGSCNVVAKKSYYTQNYFDEHNLIIAKFNVPHNSTPHIKSITKNDNKYIVDIVNIVVGDSDKTKLAICNIEIDKTPIKDAEVVINQSNENQIKGIPQVGKYSNAVKFNCDVVSTDSNRLVVSKYNTIEKLNEYKTKGNDVTKKVCALFDEAFFVNNYILAVEYQLDTVDTGVSINMQGGKININTYSTNHYVYVDESSRIVKLIPLSNEIKIDEVILTSYAISDVGEKVEPIVTKVDFE